MIWIGRTRVEVPEGSQVTITADGTMSVELPVPQPSPAPPTPVDPAEPTTDELAVVEPWFPGAEPGDTPPEPPPGPPPAFAHEDLHQFLVNTLKPLRTPQLWRMLYTEIATTIEQGEPGRPATWGIGGGLTNDGKPYEIAVRTGGWFPRILPTHEAAEQGIGPATLSRNHTRIWRLPGNELVTLSDPELRFVNDADGNHILIGRIRCVAATRQSIEHLALVIEFPAEKEDMTRRLYQQYRITEVPSGWLRVQLEINPAINLKHAPRMYLQAFVARPKAGFFRISNELLWIQDGPSAP